VGQKTMKKFLENLQLSEKAITIYHKSLEKGYLTFYELYSLVPNISQDDFRKVLNELLEINLILKIPSEDLGMLDYYLAIPPFKPILDFYSNIESNIPEINNRINDLMIQKINQIFKESEKIELISLKESIKRIRKDYEEDLLLEKKDIEEVAKELDVLKEIDDDFDNLYQKIKSLTQVQFGKLIKILTGIKTKIIDKIKPIELKKNEKEKEKIFNIVEEVFKEELQTMMSDFSETLDKLIEEEFEKISIDDTIDQAFRYRNDLKMVLLNIANNFEMKINKIADLVNEKQENLHKNIEKLRSQIISNLDVIIQNSVDQVSNLNKPMIRVINDYLNSIITPERIKIGDLWKINSVTEINEEIINSINFAKNSLTLVLPKLEEHVSPDLFKEREGDIQIKIAASNFHVNSLVKEYKSIENISYRKLENEKLIFILRDNNYAIIGIKKESEDPLDDLIGIGSNYLPFVNTIKGIVISTWSKAKPDLEAKMRGGRKKKETWSSGTGKGRLRPSQRTYQGRAGKAEPQAKDVKSPESLSSQREKSAPKPKREEKKGEILERGEKGTEKGKSKVPETTPDEPKEKVKEKAETKPSEIPTETPEPKKTPAEGKSSLYQSSISPPPGNEVSIEINAAFNSVINELTTVTGEELAKELENIAELILEKKGFSVTLHKIRSSINQFKNIERLLNEAEANEIFENIENWKERLF